MTAAGDILWVEDVARAVPDSHRIASVMGGAMLNMTDAAEENRYIHGSALR